MATHSPSRRTVAPRTSSLERLGPAVLSGFVATVAMAFVALIGYFLAIGLGAKEGNLFQQWLYALGHNPVTDSVRGALIGFVGLDFAAGLLFAVLFALDANDRLTTFPGWLRGLLFALPPFALSLVVILPLVGGGVFGAALGAGPLPVIGNLILHAVYGIVLGAMFVLNGSVDHVRNNDIGVQNALHRAETGAGIGVVAGAVIGGAVTLLGVSLVSALSSVDMLGAVVGGAIVGAALGAVFGSQAGLVEPSRVTAKREADAQATMPAATETH